MKVGLNYSTTDRMEQKERSECRAELNEGVVVKNRAR
jgi:hypothetical protein